MSECCGTPSSTGRRSSPAADRGSRASEIGEIRGGRLDSARRDHAQQVDTAAVGAQDAKLHLADGDGLAAARKPSKLLHQEAADGVVFLVRECRAEVLIELGNGREGAHGELAIALPADRLSDLAVVLVVDLSHDLLDDVL